MAKRKPFLLRLPEELMEELNRWAGDELRSLNAQIEYLLREATRRRRRRKLFDEAAERYRPGAENADDGGGD
ncbi:MAG: Arc family DNA-binding protein [bacterium]|nr:Arc family DNA-binding protein [bacterium]